MNAEAARLAVLYGNRRVGDMWPDNRALVFQYAPDWLGDAGSFAVSPGIPLAPFSQTGDAVTAFFANLLPEGPVLTAILRLKRLPQGDVFAQLQAFGEDSAGAFSIVPTGVVTVRTPSYQPYGVADIRADLARLAENLPLLAQHGELRLSLAGAQNKIPVRWEDGSFSLPVGGAASTHILKPAIQPEREFPESVLNEALCLRMASLCGLDAVQVEVVRLPETVLVVKRYDRTPSAEGVQRLHQLDFCQLAGVLPDQKYEKDGGPSLADVFTLIDRHAAIPGLDRLAAVDLTNFNYLIGNSDAHAKNMALVIQPTAREGFRLAPAYDLLCTAVYESLDTRMAMAIGGEFRPDWVRLKNWKAFAEAIKVNPTLFKKRATKLAAKALKALGPAAISLGLDPTAGVAARISRILTKRAASMATHLDGL